jgi:hypothetical protein
VNTSPSKNFASEKQLTRYPCSLSYFCGMEKLQKLELMDKILRELEDLKSSQTAVLKKVAQIEADNITLGVSLLEKKLPDLHSEVDSGVEIVSSLLEEFQSHRDKFFVDNKLEAQLDPTA